MEESKSLASLFNKNVNDKMEFKINNYIPNNVDFGLDKFDKFYFSRSERIKEAIINIIGK